jgi:beta-lactamase class A
MQNTAMKLRAAATASFLRALRRARCCGRGRVALGVVFMSLASGAHLTAAALPADCATHTGSPPSASAVPLPQVPPPPPSADSVPVSPTAPAQPWARRLQAELAAIDRASGAAIGVVVRDLDTGQSAAWRADQAWYLASTVKVPVAISVLRAVERGDFTLDTLLTLRAGDFVDGAGATNRQRAGAGLSVRYLLEQMIVHSDNTASDMLIGLVGIQAVNADVQALVPEGFYPITTLADVRRHAYAQLSPSALRLSGRDFLLLRSQPSDCARVLAFGNLVHVPVEQLPTTRLGAAYEAYYASGLNSARLDAYASLLQALAEGRALDAGHTAYLLGVMERLQTGQLRISAGLPPEARFAHKTGTQRARSCDSGLLTVPRSGAPPQRVVVVACTRGEPSVARSDRLLRQVGAALCNSGLITAGTPRAPTCPSVPRLLSGPGAAVR